jgi:cell division protein FtsZ
MIMPGLINLDFADVSAVMREMGKAMMGTGEAEGEKRAILAAESAISNPLLDHSSMKGARGVLINITGGADMTLFEVDEAANRIRDEVDPDANIIFGSTFNPNLEGKIRVSVVATGIEAGNSRILEENIISKMQNQISHTHNQQNDITINQKEENIEVSNQTIQADIIKEDNNENKVEDNIFIPQRPVDPNMNNYEQNRNFIDRNSTINSYKDEEKSNKKSLGLFGRMVNSVGFGSSNNIDEKQKISENIDKNDDLDIPAFLRRKN